MNAMINGNTPIAMLTVNELREALGIKQMELEPIAKEKKFAYGIAGIAEIFNCSMPTANRIKASGKIDRAITQIGRKVITDIDLALELAAEKNGGRRK